MKSIYIIFLTLSVLSLAQAAKDPLKRKLLLASKHKAETVLNNLAKTNETKLEGESPSLTEKKVNVTNSGASKTNSSGTTFSITVSDDLLGDEFAEKDDAAVEEGLKDKETSLTPKPRPGLTYLGQLRTLLLQFFKLLGLSTTSITEKRKNRGMDVEETNFIESTNYYREEVKNTVGAVLGRADCIQKAACRAGKYLKSFRGKEVFIVILEKFTPNKWTDTVRLVKDSAIYNGKCNYTCLDD